jgi:hypothetical protein
MPRPIVREDFEAIFKLYADKARKRFNMTGKHPPQLYSVKLGKEPGQIAETGALNRLAPKFFDGTFEKDAFRHLLQQLTTPGSLIRRAAGATGAVAPDIVVQINEIWAASVKTPKGMSKEEAMKHAESGPSPSERPDRTEKIMIALHAYQYTTMGFCDIVDKPKRHAEPGVLSPQDIKFGGRFSMTFEDGE